MIEPGKNYGWPLVSYGRHYNSAAIPHPESRPDLVKPVMYWSPRLAPGNLAYLGREIRDVAVGQDGAVWLLVNEAQGGLFRLTPTQR